MQFPLRPSSSQGHPIENQLSWPKPFFVPAAISFCFQWIEGEMQC
jgi:hypothetical protein